MVFSAGSEEVACLTNSARRFDVDGGEIDFAGDDFGEAGSFVLKTVVG
jgi:hypothetical protein